jgi:hypothetical protein
MSTMGVLLRCCSSINVLRLSKLNDRFSLEEHRAEVLARIIKGNKNLANFLDSSLDCDECKETICNSAFRDPCVSALILLLYD